MVLQFCMSKKEPSTKKLTFSRYIWFIDQARKRRIPPTKADYLNKFEIEEAQFFRDLAFMRDRLGAPIVHVRFDNGKKHGYRLDESEGRFEMPLVWIEEDELLLMAIAKELIRDQDSRKLLDSLFQKILPVNSKADVQAVSRLVSFKGSGFYRIEENGVLNRLIALLLESREARLTYCPVFGDGQHPVQMTVMPLHLLFYKNNWYLLARSRDKLRTYSLSRIREVSGGEQRERGMDEKELQKTIDRTFGIFVTDENKPVQTIRLRFSASLARYIRTVVFHPQQMVSEPMTDGGIEISFPSTVNRELIGEVMRYIDEVEIIEPEELRTEILKILQNGLSKLTRTQQ